MGINKEAWVILKPDEQTALSLSLSFSKSTWEAGEIMGKAHFKYLEIQKRARKFLEMFTNHFEKYGQLIPPEVLMPQHFKEYLHLTMLQRLNISKAIRAIDDYRYSVASVRNRAILLELTKLRDTQTEASQDLYSLIMDFDRWNNFRILPLELQEPSAFKRRNKARSKKHLKNITSLPKLSVLRIIEKFTYTGKAKSLYLVVISNYFDSNHRVLKVKEDKKLVTEVSDIGLFLYKDKAIAEEFGRLVSNYFLAENKNCRLGQKFWPEFRVLLSKADNFKEIENIHKSRTYLDKAIFDTDERLVKKRKEREYKGETPTEDINVFYKG
jgi:hypothetical protein